MQILATIGADLGLLFTLLFSAQIAAGWGELCGIRPGLDKSGHGGFAAMYILFAIRWSALALGVLVVGTGSERWMLLGAHTALGVVSTMLFEHCCARVRADRFAPNALGLLAGVVAPTPITAIVALRANAIWSGDSATTLGVFVLALLAVHFGCYESRRRDRLRPEVAQPATTQ